RGPLLRAGHEPDPRRPGTGTRAAPDDRDRKVQRPGGDCLDRGGEAPGRRAGAPCPVPARLATGPALAVNRFQLVDSTALSIIVSRPAPGSQDVGRSAPEALIPRAIRSSRAVRRILAVFLLVLAFGASLGPSDAGAATYVPGRLLMKFSSGATDLDRSAVL